MNNNPTHDAGVSFEVSVTNESIQDKDYVKKPISLWRRLRRLVWHIVARQLTLLCLVALTIACWIGRRRRQLLPEEGCEIMLTGRFDSDNWILSHLKPLSASNECSRVWMISTNRVPALLKVVAIYPPKLLIRVLGATQARLLIFLWKAMRNRPHIVGGFNIMFNGIAAVIVGRLTGARSMYFCVGGPPEICDGGIHSVESLFTKMETADDVVERRLLKVVKKSDMLITMGTKAIKFFQDKGINTNCHIVSGGIDPVRFQPAKEVPLYDLILTGRLVEIKRIDIFLEAIKNVVKKIPDVRAVIVGDGKLRDELRALSVDLRIECNVSFVGHHNDVENWLRKSKMFILTSDSEGLSLSVMEAMMCGLPAVVSDVGDLNDLVEDGINGYLVPRRSPESFAVRILELLSDNKKLKVFSNAARQSAIRYTTKATKEEWNRIIRRYRSFSKAKCSKRLGG